MKRAYQNSLLRHIRSKTNVLGFLQILSAGTTNSLVLTRTYFCMITPLIPRLSLCLFTLFAYIALALCSYAEPSYEKAVLPVLEEFCFDCHGDGADKGGVRLDDYADDIAMMADRKGWETVRINLQEHIMPPTDKPQPSAAQREEVMQWISSEVFEVDCNKPDPGRVTIRRLNRTEYRNTIKELLQVDFKSTEILPPDDTGYGYDTIGDVLSLSPVLLEKYFDAAESILDEAIQVGPPKPKTQLLAASKLNGGSSSGDFKVLASNGAVGGDFEAVKDGEYIFSVLSEADHAGPELPRMEFFIDRKKVASHEVKAKRNQADWYRSTVTLKRGKRKFEARFANDYYNPKAKDRSQRDRNLYVGDFKLEGPKHSGPYTLPEGHRSAIAHTTTKREEMAETARRNLEMFVSRAYRRPALKADIDRLLPLVAMAVKDGAPFERGMQLAMHAVLVSPKFLFRGEVQDSPDNPKQLSDISEFDLASRLSYFLWSSMPDEELFAQAKAGTLRRNLKDQLLRMLNDPKADALEAHFAGQWLQLRNLDLVSPDPKRFAAFTPDLKQDMRTETEKLFRFIRTENRSIIEFLSADYSFINERLAGHYDIPNVKGNDFRRVKFADNRRRGVLTHGSILTITSLPTRTSPVNRGRWITENILGTPVPTAPDDVPDLDDSKTAVTGATLRERLESHREKPMCASCHDRLDPLGFGLENFDGIGKWRDKDQSFTIDAGGKLASGEEFRNHEELMRILAREKKDNFTRCFVRNILTYALGRGLEYYDRCAVEEITDHASANGYIFSTVIEAIVNSTPFQKRRGDSSSESPAD